MPRFKYRAINPSGKIINGNASASNYMELESRLQRQDIELIRARKINTHSGVFQRRQVKRRELINFCFHLEQLTKAGVPLIESLKDLQESLGNSYLSDIASTIVAEIEDGKTFSQALANFPKTFSQSFVSLIEAGERSGELSQVLYDLAKSLRWQDELIAQTKKALTYPSFVAVVITAVVFFLMIYLVPQLLGFITSMHKEIPFHTEVLIFVSDVFVNHWYLIIGLPILFSIVLKILYRSNARIRMLLDRVKLRIWVIGPIYKKIILARFTNYFALLFNAGIPVIQCLQLTEGIVDNKVIETALHDCRQHISEGESLSNAFRLTAVFPSLVVRMVSVGENSGNLNQSLLNVSYFFKRDVDEGIEKMQSLIEPVITCLLGLILGWVMLSVLNPVYDLLSQIQV